MYKQAGGVAFRMESQRTRDLIKQATRETGTRLPLLALGPKPPPGVESPHWLGFGTVQEYVTSSNRAPNMRMCGRTGFTGFHLSADVVGGAVGKKSPFVPQQKPWRGFCVFLGLVFLCLVPCLVVGWLAWSRFVLDVLPAGLAAASGLLLGERCPKPPRLVHSSGNHIPKATHKGTAKPAAHPTALSQPQTHPQSSLNPPKAAWMSLLCFPQATPRPALMKI